MTKNPRHLVYDALDGLSDEFYLFLLSVIRPVNQYVANTIADDPTLPQQLDAAIQAEYARLGTEEPTGTDLDATRGPIFDALAAMPDEAFGWFVLAAQRDGGSAQIWPDGTGGFTDASRAAITAVRQAAADWIARPR